MADNVTLDAGTGGAVVATDQNGTAEHYQWVKLVYGGDNEFSKVDGTQGLPVAIVDALPAGTASIGVVVLGAGAAQFGKLAAGTASIGKVGLNAGTAAIGKLAAGTAQIGKLAAGTANVGIIILGAGATQIGKLAAGTANIGDVDVASALPAGTATIGNVGVVTRSAGGAKIFHSVDLDESHETVSTGPVTVYGMYFWNAGTAPLWVGMYNGTATGTAAPPVNFPIPANADSDVAGVVIPTPAQGIGFTVALIVRVLTAVGAGTAGPGANQAGAIITYKD